MKKNHFFLILLTIKVSNCQIDGEFWWMNDKISGLQSVKPEKPQFEVISEFANDENDMIIFKDDNILKNDFDQKHRDIESASIYDSENVTENTTKINLDIYEDRQLENTTKFVTTAAGVNNLESTKIVMKDNKKGMSAPNLNPGDVSTNQTKDVKKGINSPNSSSVDVSTNPTRDYRKEMHVLNLNPGVSADRTKYDIKITFPNFNSNYFPTNLTRNDNNEIIFPISNSANSTIKPAQRRNDLRNGLSFGLVEDSRKHRVVWPNNVRQNIGGKMQTDSKKISKVTSMECGKIDGKDKGAFKNLDEETTHSVQSKNTGRHPAKIIFPDSQKRTKYNKNDDRIRFVRSADEFQTLPTAPSVTFNRKLLQDSSSPRRRNILWQRIRTLKPTPSGGSRRIVTEDEDPYWNIKNVFSISNFSRLRNTKISTGYGEDYDYDLTPEVPRPVTQDEYADEMPKPMHFNWADFNRNVGQGTKNGFGYDEGGYYQSPVLNPRYDHVTSSTGLGVRTEKPTESEEIIDEESEYTSSYSSHREYQVFQDFKLPNLFGKRNKTRIITEKPADYDSLESVAIFPSKARPSPDDDGGIKYLPERQAWPKCGEVSIDDESDYGGPRKELVFGSRPWLTLVTRSSGDGKTLCTATLVHPRAALTAASCVHGAARGEVSIRAGGWDLGSAAEPLSPQQRRATVRSHRGYRPGELGNDLAILYWETALKLCASVRPACLTDPADDDTCKFVGWGGADGSVFRRRPTEQRALVLSAQACAAHLRRVTATARVPRGVFCARVLTPGCAAGAGGALVCGAGRGARAAAGVASWRGSCDVTSPVVLTASREWTLQTLRDLDII